MSRRPAKAPATVTALAAATGGPTVTRVVGLADDGAPLLDLGRSEPVPARMTEAVARHVGPELVGREVVVLFEDDDGGKPVALALLHRPGSFSAALDAADREQPDLDATIDGERVVIRAERKLELRCGQASIVIDADGKITIRGAHLYNRATGPIRIKGGHVDIN